MPTRAAACGSPRLTSTSPSSTRPTRRSTRADPRASARPRWRSSPSNCPRASPSRSSQPAPAYGPHPALATSAAIAQWAIAARPWSHPTGTIVRTADVAPDAPHRPPGTGWLEARCWGDHLDRTVWLHLTERTLLTLGYGGVAIEYAADHETFVHALEHAAGFYRRTEGLRTDTALLAALARAGILLSLPAGAEPREGILA